VNDKRWDVGTGRRLRRDILERKTAQMESESDSNASRVEIRRFEVKCNFQNVTFA